MGSVNNWFWSSFAVVFLRKKGNCRFIAVDDDDDVWNFTINYPPIAPNQQPLQPQQQHSNVDRKKIEEKPRSLSQQLSATQTTAGQHWLLSLLSHLSDHHFLVWFQLWPMLVCGRRRRHHFLLLIPFDFVHHLVDCVSVCSFWLVSFLCSGRSNHTNRHRTLRLLSASVNFCLLSTFFFSFLARCLPFD